MKVLNINSYFEQYFYHNLFDELKKEGINLDVAVPCAEKDSRYDYLVNKYDVLHCYKKIDRFFIRKKIKKIAHEIIKKYKVENYDLLHAHSLISNGGPAYEIYKRTNINYIVAVRGADVFGLNKVFFLHYFYFRKIILNASKIIFISPSCKKAFLHFFKGKKIRDKIIKDSEIITNGIENLFFENQPLTKKTLIDKKPIRLLFCGVNRKNKNTVFVAKTIAKYNLNCKYTIVGSKVSDKVESKLSKYSFVNRINNVSAKELIGLYSENDIFIMVSKKETFGLTYIEALSQGLPIIYSKGTGIDGLFLEGKVGYHASVSSKKDLMKTIKLVIESYDKLAQACVEMSKQFKWSDIALKYNNIYHFIAKGEDR